MRLPPRNACNCQCACIAIAISRRESWNLPVMIRHCARVNFGHGSHDWGSTAGSRHDLKVRQHKSLKARFTIDQHFPLSENPPEDEYYRSWSYRWALDLLPFFLEKSAISLEVADVLRSRTFTMMGEKIPRRR